MRSLAGKLTIAFVLVAILSVALLGVFLRVRTEREVSQFVYDRNMVQLTNSLHAFFTENGSWEGAGEVFAHSRITNSQFNWGQLTLALVDPDLRVVYGQGEFAAGQLVPVMVIERAQPLLSDGVTVGWLVARRPLPPRPDPLMRDTAESGFLERMARSILFSVLAAAALATVLGVLLARSISRPVHELTAATQEVASGQLGRQVTVRSDDELGHLAQSFNRMSSDLLRASQQRQQMTADVAHELRTPLSLLLGYTEALEDGKLQGTPEAFAVMHDAARQLQRLVDDLGVLALADSGELRLNRRLVDPRLLLERAYLAHQPAATSAGIRLELDAPDELPAVELDPDRCTQVLANLITNALRHTPAGGSITLVGRVVHSGSPDMADVSEGSKARTMVQLAVSDSGVGIAPEDLPHIFDRFYRGSKSRQQEHGEVGLGLAIARSLVESHGGRLTVESSVGAGTSFTISLPVAQVSPPTARGSS